MGNCSFKSVAIGDAKESNSIRIMTDCGDVVEFEGPKFTGKVLGDFPGYGIFRQGRTLLPLPDNEELRSGQIYLLLPLGEDKVARTIEDYDLIHASRKTALESTQNMKDSRNLNEERSSEAEAARMSDSLSPACRQTNSESTQDTKAFKNLNNKCSSEAKAERMSDKLLEPTWKGKKPTNISKDCTREPEPEPVRMSTSVEVLPPPQKGIWSVKFAIDTKQLEDILSKEVNTEALIEQMRLAASSGTVTPRRTKISWANMKPMFSSVFKNSVNRAILSQSNTGSLIQRKTANEDIAAT